jgi:dolichyl-phosphate-mannose--protein O-mannosyl transferase
MFRICFTENLGILQLDKLYDFWIVIPAYKQYVRSGNPVSFNSVIGLKHQQSGLNLHSHSMESPGGETISLRHARTKKSLSSHDFMMNNGYQEITCHDDGHEENHKVNQVRIIQYRVVTDYFYSQWYVEVLE